MVGLLTSFTFTINRSLLFDLCTGTTCFKRKKSRFLDFLFTTYARSTSPHHQQVSIEAPELLTFVVLFSLYKIGRHVQSVYTWYEIKVIFQSLLPDIYANFDTAVPKSVGHSVYCCPHEARGYLLVYDKRD